MKNNISKPPTFVDVAKVENDLEKNDLIYQILDEDKRLNSRVGQVEFLTTLSAIKNVLKSDSKILDVGAGTGAYALALAKAGYEVVAFEPATNNYHKLQENISKANKSMDSESDVSQLITTYQASSFDLKGLPSRSFDVILLFGPLYHLNDQSDRLQTLMEARRICKPNGYIFIAFINHDMIPFTETVYNPNWFSGDTYDHATMRVENSPFVFFNLNECETLLSEVNLKIERIIASDGFTELLGKEINEMSAASYRQYLKWHQTICEKPEFLGASNHFLFVCSQKESIEISYSDQEKVIKEIGDFCNLSCSFEGFLDTDIIVSEDLTLELNKKTPANIMKNWLPSYNFRIFLKDKFIGGLDLRIGYNEAVYYGGNIGYCILDEYRGNGYAGKACKMIVPLARAHNMSVLHICNEYRNYASRRVCEKLGAEHMRTVLIPQHNVMYGPGHYFENIFKWNID